MDFHDQLDVFLNENKIGTLFTDNGVMSFAYDTEFLNTPGAYTLSKNLPLKEGFFTDPEVEGFFFNLLQQSGGITDKFKQYCNNPIAKTVIRINVIVPPETRTAQRAATHLLTDQYSYEATP